MTEPKEVDPKAPPAAAPKLRKLHDAAALLATARTVEQAVSAAGAKDDGDDWQYYVRCTRGCMGIFLVGGHPHGKALGNKDWFSDYHDTGEQWQIDIFCQVCSYAAMRTDNPEAVAYQLPVGYIPSKSRKEVLFMVPPEYLFRFPKDPARLAEMRANGQTGHHRATLMSNPIMNDGIPADLKATLAREGANVR